MPERLRLRNGQYTLLDACDKHRFEKLKLYVNLSGVVTYKFIEGKWRIFKLSRLILDAPDELVVDHIDGNVLDNRRRNLRLCTKAQNNQNARKMKRAGTSRFKGVYWHRQNKGWSASIMADGKKHSLGTFRVEQHAADAYNSAAKRLHGEFASLN